MPIQQNTELSEISLATIIVNYRAADILVENLPAIVEEHTPFNASIYIVDNNSDNGDLEKLNAAVAYQHLEHCVQVIAHHKNDGFGAGNNIALQKIKDENLNPDYIFFLNPDAHLKTGCLQTLLMHLKTHPKAGMVGARLLSETGEIQSSAFRFFSIAGELESTIRTGPFSKLLANAIIAMPPQEKSLKVDWVSGAAFMVSATILDDIGWFDEAFFLYFEETDLMRRTQAAGYNIWHIPDAQAIHLEGYSTGTKGGAHMEKPPSDHWYRSRNLYFRKHHSFTKRFLADLAWITGASLYMLRCLLTGKPTGPQCQKIKRFLGHWGKTNRLG